MSAMLLIFTFVFATPANALAAGLEVSGWIPYWRTEAGTKAAGAHIDQFTEINPFAYSVKSDGSLADTAKIGGSDWKSLFKKAGKAKVRIVPTLMWSDTENIHKVLSNPTTRAAHIKAIVNMVDKEDFDGVDIDYEGKKAETRDYYSSFLRELSIALKKESPSKWLQCTIEARMPLAARFSGTPPANIEYANDLPRVNQYCDRIRIMTYDQQTADIQLNREHAGEPYGPVADAEWVEKVVNYMDNDMDRSKMVLGVPTYGNIYQLMPNVSGNGFSYIKTEAFNPGYGDEIAEEYDLTPSRGPSGEMELTYVPKNSNKSLPTQKELARLAPKGTDSAYLASAGALAYAKKEHKQTPVTYLTWSDAGAIKQKADLAEELDVAGVAIFKIDGGFDPDMWDAFAKKAPKVTKAPRGNPGDPIITTPVITPTTPTAPALPSAPSATYQFKTDLEAGMESADVRKLQDILLAKGYLKATPNGYFGPATLAAVTAWQRANGLPATGFFGPQSRLKMNSGK
jgi:spore germination protein YaaH